MKNWPAIAKQTLAIFLLCLLAIAASGWAGLYCYHFGSPYAAHDTYLTVLQEASAGEGVSPKFWVQYLPYYYFWTALAAVWLGAMAVYIWRTRASMIGLALAALPVALFVWASLGNLRMLWPFCNSF